MSANKLLEDLSTLIGEPGNEEDLRKELNYSTKCLLGGSLCIEGACTNCTFSINNLDEARKSLKELKELNILLKG